MQALRTTFLLLVLGNLLLFAWGQGHFGGRSGGEAERLAGEIEPGRLRIVGRGAPPAAQPVRGEACRLLVGLDVAAAGRLADLLAEAGPALRVTQQPEESSRLWWVFIPPLPNAAQAEAKAAELSRLGVKDFHVVREEGANRHAISLGLYRSEEAAQARLKALARRNVKTARIAVREEPGERRVIELRGDGALLARTLTTLPEEFAGLTVGECPP